MINTQKIFDKTIQEIAEVVKLINEDGEDADSKIISDMNDDISDLHSTLLDGSNDFVELKDLKNYIKNIVGKDYFSDKRCWEYLYDSVFEVFMDIPNVFDESMQTGLGMQNQLPTNSVYDGKLDDLYNGGNKKMKKLINGLSVDDACDIAKSNLDVDGKEYDENITIINKVSDAWETYKKSWKKFNKEYLEKDFFETITYLKKNGLFNKKANDVIDGWMDDIEQIFYSDSEPNEMKLNFGFGGNDIFGLKENKNMNKRLKEKEIITSLQDAWDENNKERFLSIVYYLENTRRITSKEAKILKTVYDDWEEYKSENPNAKISFAGDIKIRMDIKENKNMNKRLEEKSGNEEDEKIALAQFLDIDVEEVEDGYTDHVYEAEGKEYWVSDYDTAYDEAVEECENLFDDLGLEAVSESTQEYFLENEDYCSFPWKDDMHDSNLSYATDIDSESGDDGYATRLVSEAIDRKVIKDKDCFENDDGELDYEDKDELAEMLADDLDDDYDSMSEWFESIYGRNWVIEVKDTLKDYLDYHAMAEYVVDEDSIANTLARYDGKENTEKVDGVEYYIYRTN